MEAVLVGLALGALVVAKRGRSAIRSAVGWSARKSGWIASRVRTSIDEAAVLVRDEYKRGCSDARAEPSARVSLTNGGSGGHPAPPGE